MDEITIALLIAISLLTLIAAGAAAAAFLLLWGKLSEAIRRLETLTGMVSVILLQTREKPPERGSKTSAAGAASPAEPPLIRRSAASPAPNAAPAAHRPAPRPTPPVRTVSPLEERTARLLRRIWNWICVGEEFRPRGISAEYAAVTAWLIRAGTVIMLFGGGFLLKYSFDRNFLPPEVRVPVIMAAGLAAAILGARFAGGKYRMLNLAVSGAGFVLMYLGIFAGVRLYSLFGTAAAMAMAAAVTAGAVFTARRTDGLLTGVIGCLGGFMAPVLFSVGRGNPAALALWMTLLNVGVACSAINRRWILLEILSLAGYGVISLAAFNCLSRQEYFMMLGFFVFNMLVFDGAALLRRQRLTALDFTLLAANQMLFLLLSLPGADEFNTPWRLPALIALGSALVDLGCRRLFAGNAGKEFFGVLAALNLALAAVLAASGVWRGALPMLEALAVLEIGRRGRCRSLSITGAVLFLPAALTAVAAACGIRSEYPLRLLQSFASEGLASATILAAGAVLAKTVSSDGRRVFPQLPALFFAVGGGWFFCWLTREVFNMLSLWAAGFRHGGVTVLWALLAVLMLIPGIRRGMPVLRHLGVILLGICACKILFFDLSGTAPLWRIASFAAVGALLLLGAVLYIRRREQFRTDR